MVTATAWPDQYVLRKRKHRLSFPRLLLPSRNGSSAAGWAPRYARYRKFSTPADAVLYATTGGIRPREHGREVVRIDYAGTREPAVLGTVRDLAAEPEDRRLT